ncbi:Peroxidasin-like protein [Hypsibius exemplaris]|uniref:Peroxidasin-like protein n=1 Tax=Hypsibius exemplaris TaxID=2072580 RepID=A0A9X6RMK9_HYPEX|nr:Peroxidasin-like protein [Hypsibius exemplaris]
MVTADFVEDHFKNAVAKAVKQFDKPDFATTSGISSAAQSNAFGATGPDALMMAKDALVVEDFASSLSKKIMPDAKSPDARASLKKIDLPPSLSLFMPSAQATTGRKTKTAVCDDKEIFTGFLGDLRCNVNLGLQTLYSLWLRQHNSLAFALSKINPDWDEETLYQEARAIVAARLQHIVYNKWLPVLLGPETINTWGLNLMPSGRYHGYDATVNAGLANEFSAAAFRVGLTMATGVYIRLSGAHEPLPEIRLSNTFFKANEIYKLGMLDEVLRGMTDQSGKIVENSATTELSQHLFPTNGTALFGLDLISVNIQRGRDHGLPAYRNWRKLCGLSTADNFVGLKRLQIFPDDVIDKLAKIYESVKDIDLYPAGIAEASVDGGIIGPTFSCIIGEQFQRFRSGDRFWYENDLPLSSRLTDDQRNAIRQTTLASVLCNNVAGINSIQASVFRTVSDSNLRLPCSDIRPIDLGPWLRA